ncbi:hypothetical protein ACEPAF_2621 [Sanghuangporus sanghuang]
MALPSWFTNSGAIARTILISSIIGVLSLGALGLATYPSLPLKRSNKQPRLTRCALEADSSWSRYKESGNREDLDAAVCFKQAALDACPHGHADRSAILLMLSHLLYLRYKKWQGADDLGRAITLNRDALELRSEGHHPDRAVPLSNLAASLRSHFQQSGRMTDLEETITLGRAALEIRPEGHPDRSLSLGDLSIDLGTRFRHTGRMDLEEAISVGRAALELQSEGHPNRPLSLGNLAMSLWTSHEYVGSTIDLEEAIELERAAPELRPEGHPDRSRSLGGLATSLRTCFQRGGRVADLEEAIAAERAALQLRPEGHPDRSLSLGNLAISLRVRFQHGRRMADLEEAVCWDVLRSSFDQVVIQIALEEAILLERAALELRPDGHPDRSLSLSHLAEDLGTRFEHGGRMVDL